jgi:hypothetical protein
MSGRFRVTISAYGCGQRDTTDAEWLTIERQRVVEKKGLSMSLVVMNDERRWDRSSWVVLLAVIVLWLTAISSAYGALVQPTDGWLATQQGELPPPRSVFVGGWPNPLQAGDRVFAIGGTAQNSDFLTLNRPTAPPAGWMDGGSVPYTVKRGEQTLLLDVPIRRLSSAGILRAFAATAIDTPSEWGYFLIAALVFALRPGSAAARLLFLFGGAHAAVTKLAWTAPNIIFAPPAIFWANTFISVAWGYAILPALLLLALSFPQRTWLVRRFPQLVPALIFGVSFLASALATFTSNGVLAVIVLGVLIASFLLVLIITSALTLWRSHDPVARAQTGWVLLGLGLSIGLTFIIYLLLSLLPDTLTTIQRVVPQWAQSLQALAMPICLAIAITRYRLFDIDVIIRRTLVYTLLTLTLGLVYVGCILVSRILVAPLTGGSELAIVVSTLAIAALFTPLRRRIQNFIDKRFYRRKYDATKVLAAFGTTARDETNLDALTGELLRVVDETMQPEFVGLWLRDSGTGSAARSTSSATRQTE